jgi:hypothetical protein
MASQRRTAIALILESAAMAAILLTSAHAALAESVFNLPDVNNQAFVGIVWPDDSEDINSLTTPTASATLGTESGVAYADAFSTYSLSNNNATLTIEGHITAHGGSTGSGGYGYGGAVTQIAAGQNITRLTRLHIVGTMSRSILAGPDGHPEDPYFVLRGANGGTVYNQVISSQTGTISFDDTVEVSSRFGFEVYELYASAIAAEPSIPRYGYGSGSSSYSISITMTEIPEPSTLVLLGIGAISLLAFRWRQKRATT